MHRSTRIIQLEMHASMNMYYAWMCIYTRVCVIACVTSLRLLRA